MVHSTVLPATRMAIRARHIADMSKLTILALAAFLSIEITADDQRLACDLDLICTR